MTELAAFRVYASTPESVEYLQNATIKNEVHIVLAFARDYDGADQNQLGKFETYFHSNFNAQVIKAIKEGSKSTVKFFLSIGGRNAKYPFQIPYGRRDEWVTNAVASLKKIVQKYGFDGIDIYYEHVTSTTEFPTALREVIWQLKDNEEVISSASLTVSAPLNSLYTSLYKKGSADFDHVVYQSHSVTTPISTFEELVKVFDGLTDYGKNKIFAGHSDVLPSDWKTVPLPIFLGAVPKLLQKGMVSISKWIVTGYDPEA